MSLELCLLAVQEQLDQFRGRAVGHIPREPHEAGALRARLFAADRHEALGSRAQLLQLRVQARASRRSARGDIARAFFFSRSGTCFFRLSFAGGAALDAIRERIVQEPDEVPAGVPGATGRDSSEEDATVTDGEVRAPALRVALAVSRGTSGARAGRGSLPCPIAHGRVAGNRRRFRRFRRVRGRCDRSRKLGHVSRCRRTPQAAAGSLPRVGPRRPRWLRANQPPRRTYHCYNTRSPGAAQPALNPTPAC
mmetsp:Transcript_36262/g.99957  ORF Transcript_36262/g.99957 Transcript_36262/m.99957 type:complete len:251 (-) Transcript_36262:22-774(-)